MNHKIRVKVRVEKRGFLGSRFRWCSRGAGMGGHPVDFEERSGMMQTAMKAKKPRNQAVSGRFWAGSTYRGRIKDDHKIDPCSGSGHILAYMFDVLMKIYESYGYTTREAVASIVENNIYGLDIDDRAAQLAYFAVMMKARQYDRRFFNRGIQPHVYAIVESNHVDKFAVEYFCNGDAKLKAAMDTIISELHDAKEYGSILTITPQDWFALYSRFVEIVEDIHMSREAALRELLPLVQVAEVLSIKYRVVITNPPYMGDLNKTLQDYVKKNYPNSKHDLCSVFIDRCLEMVNRNAYTAMITQNAFMFLSRYEKMRRNLLKFFRLQSMMG